MQVELTCTICGATFERRRGGGHVPLTCGSDECKKARRAQSVREYRWRQRGGSTTQQRVCLNCGVAFEFVRVAGVRGAGPSMCSDDCRDARARQSSRENAAAFRQRMAPEERARRRRIALLATYGLTSESYDAMVTAQGGVCAICGQVETKHHSLLLKIDHDRSCCSGHSSCGKCVRGLLCSNCNSGLGLFGDNPDVIRAAADYLSRQSP